MHDHAFFDPEDIRLCGSSAKEESPACSWIPHPSFPGVFLKHVVCGKQAGGRCSCHVVRVDPGCALCAHRHDSQMEVHHVLSGNGGMVLDGDTRAYFPGMLGVIPQGALHEVRAGEDGLVLLATFVPPLL